MKINLNTLGLNLAPQKTVFIVFDKNNIQPGELEIQIDEFTVKSSESVRFLGILFDYKLSFKLQIDHIKKRCFRALNINQISLWNMVGI